MPLNRRSNFTPARTLGLAATPALLVALAGCSLQPRPMRTAAAAPAPVATRTTATPAPSTQPTSGAQSAHGAVDPVDPFALASAPGGASEQAGNTVDPFAPWNNAGSAPNVFGELAEGGPHGAATSGDDFAENLRQITFSQVGADFQPDISRDGKWITFASTQHSTSADLYIKPIGSHAVTRLTNDPGQDIMPAFSPDGRRIAFASNRDGSWDIYVMSVGGGQPIQLTEGESHELHPTWSPDGKHIAFCRLNPASNKWELWVIDAMHPGVARFIGHGLFPRWSPTGDTIAFQKSRDRGDRFFAIWTVDFVEGEAINPTEIASSPVAAFLNPTWSPDGSRLAFAAIPNPQGGVGSDIGSRPASADIWMVEMNGSGRSRLTGGQFVNLMPVWAPDWRLYFVSDRGGNDNIWSLRPDRAMIAARGEAPGVYAQRTPEQRGMSASNSSNSSSAMTRSAPRRPPAQSQAAVEDHEMIEPGSPEAIVRGIPTPLPATVAAPRSEPQRKPTNPTNFVYAPDTYDDAGPEH
jgi:TolB protein